MKPEDIARRMVLAPVGSEPTLEEHLARIIRLARVQAATEHKHSEYSGDGVAQDGCQHKDCLSIQHVERVLIHMLKQRVDRDAELQRIDTKE